MQGCLLPLMSRLRQDDRQTTDRLQGKHIKRHREQTEKSNRVQEHTRNTQGWHLLLLRPTSLSYLVFHIHAGAHPIFWCFLLIVRDKLFPEKTPLNFFHLFSLIPTQCSPSSLRGRPPIMRTWEHEDILKNDDFKFETIFETFLKTLCKEKHLRCPTRPISISFSAKSFFTSPRPRPGLPAAWRTV